MTRQDAIDRLTELLERMNADELRVLAKFASKIVRGGEKHGPMNLAEDTRDWNRERHEERVDDACYGFMEEVQGEILAERAKADPVMTGLREMRAASPIQTGDLYSQFFGREGFKP